MTLNRTLPIFAAFCLCAWMGGRSVALAKSATPVPPGGLPDAWIPSQAVFLLHSSQPDTILDVLLDPAVTAQVPMGKAPAAVLTGIARYLESQLGCDWKTALRRLMRKGFTFAAAPGGATVMIAQAEDAAFLAKGNDAFVQAGRWGGSSKVAQTVHGETNCWTIDGGKEYHALAGEALILSNRLELLHQVLDLRSGAASPSESLAGLPDFQFAKEAARVDAEAVLFVGPELVKALPISRRKSQAEQQPLVALLLGRNPGPSPNPAEEWLALDLDADGRALSVRVTGDKLAGQAAAFAAPQAGDGVLPNVSVPRQIAGLSLWRDLHGFYAAKDSLFPERTSALILFENLMGIYFSGRDLTEDVLGALDPHVRLVAAEQAYDPATGTPALKLPGFAAVFRMREPEKFGPVIEEAWQKAIGLVNITRGQKAQPGLVIDKRDYGGVRYSFASFSAAGEPDKTKLDSRFNFQPALVRDGEFLIICSTTQLADDLIDALRSPVKPVAGSNAVIEIDGARLATIVAENRESIIKGNMLKKGQERAAAEKDLGQLMTVVKLLEQATLRTGEAASQRFVDLRLELGPMLRANR